MPKVKPRIYKSRFGQIWYVHIPGKGPLLFISFDSALQFANEWAWEHDPLNFDEGF